MGRRKKSTGAFDGWGSEVNRGKHAMIMLKLLEVFGQFGDLYGNIDKMF